MKTLFCRVGLGRFAEQYESNGLLLDSRRAFSKLPYGKAKPAEARSRQLGFSEPEPSDVVRDRWLCIKVSL